MRTCSHSLLPYTRSSQALSDTRPYAPVRTIRRSAHSSPLVPEPSGRDPSCAHRAPHSTPRRSRADGLLVNTSMHAVRAATSGTRTSTASSSPTQPSTHACRRSCGTSHAPKGLDRLELIPAAVRIEEDAETLRGHVVLHLVGTGTKPATMPLTVPVLRVLEACRGQRTEGPLVLRPLSGNPIDRRDAYRMVARIASPHSLRHADPAPPSTTTAPAATSTATASTSSPPSSPPCEPTPEHER